MESRFIMSPDGTRIINLLRAKMIYASRNLNGRYYAIVSFGDINDRVFIGEYETSGEAVEAVREIYRFLSGGEGGCTMPGESP